MNAASARGEWRTPRRASAAVGASLGDIGRTAVLALYHELALPTKPGLVSFVDSGSHDDMDADTFMRSLFALRSYFASITQAGADEASFEVLERLGIEAERRMLAATGGINTHRGAIFSLGLLCAAAGRTVAQGAPLTSERLRCSVLDGWGDALRTRAAARECLPARSPGQRATRAFGLRSAGAEAALGFPLLFEITVPALRSATRRGAGAHAALTHALMRTIGELADTNLAHRGGLEGLRYAQNAATAFLARGSVFRPGWRDAVARMHGQFVARRRSPGGSADLLACAWWVQRLCDHG
jgi:triphosphoribosyl-dephospho-CoA synthase